MQDVKIGRTDWKEVGHEVYFMGGMPILGPNLGFGFLDDVLHGSILLRLRGVILLPWNAITNIEGVYTCTYSLYKIPQIYSAKYSWWSICRHCMQCDTN